MRSWFLCTHDSFRVAITRLIGPSTGDERTKKRRKVPKPGENAPTPLGSNSADRANVAEGAATSGTNDPCRGLGIAVSVQPGPRIIKPQIRLEQEAKPTWPGGLLPPSSFTTHDYEDWKRDLL